MHPLDAWYARITVDDIINISPRRHRKRIGRRLAKIAQQDGSEVELPKITNMVGGRLGIRDTPPLIYHPEGARGREFEMVLKQLFGAYKETLSDDRRVLLDHYRVMDAAIKVVGVGSVGRRCWVALLMSACNDPLFLQLKEAVPSVLEPCSGKSAYPHHGQRVVMGQRLMQPASDVFSAGARPKPRTSSSMCGNSATPRSSPLWKPLIVRCFWVTPRRADGWSHGLTPRLETPRGSVVISGSGDQFDKAVGDFSVAYADQAECDHAALKDAVRQGKVTASLEA